jgi:hypothetical protein
MGDKPKPQMIKRFDLENASAPGPRPGLGNAQKLGLGFSLPQTHRGQSR